MNVECAVWDVERDVERAAGVDWCAHPPIVKSQLQRKYNQIQTLIQNTNTIQIQGGMLELLTHKTASSH